jgi:hypothetical protein
MEEAVFHEFIAECVRRHLFTPEISPEDYLAAKRSQLEREVTLSPITKCRQSRRLRAIKSSV